MSCLEAVLSGIPLDCDTINAAIGAERDLIIVNYADYDKAATTQVGNIETDDSNNNEGGLSAIELKTGAMQYVFEGTDYSVVPNCVPEVREDGDMWYIHSMVFTVYSKKSKDRTTLESMGGNLVVAISVDRSTGLYEIFGADQGLKMSALDRVYTGAQNSNFYTVTLATPDIAVVRESKLPQLAVAINTAV